MSRHLKIVNEAVKWSLALLFSTVSFSLLLGLALAIAIHYGCVGPEYLGTIFNTLIVVIIVSWTVIFKFLLDRRARLKNAPNTESH